MDTERTPCGIPGIDWQPGAEQDLPSKVAQCVGGSSHQWATAKRL